MHTVVQQDGMYTVAEKQYSIVAKTNSDLFPGIKLNFIDPI